MITARSFLRFAVAGLFVNALAMACVVTNSDDEEECRPGSRQDCTCADGTESERVCNSSGTRFGSCACGDPSSGGTGNDAAGAGNTSEAGSGNAGGDTGSGGGSGDTGGAPNGTAGSSGENGGAGGSGEVDAGLCAEEPNDSCADCYQQGCCDEWTACVEDEGDDGNGDCLTQFLNIIACAEDLRSQRAVTKADVIQCAADEVEGGSGWSAGLRPTVKPVIDCVGGGEGWDTEAGGWSDLSCRNNCFSQL